MRSARSPSAAPPCSPASVPASRKPSTVHERVTLNEAINLCKASSEYFGVRTAWARPGDASPIAHAAQLAVELSSYVIGRAHGGAQHLCGVIIYGRSDAVLNPGGVRIGTADIYRQVEPLPDTCVPIHSTRRASCASALTDAPPQLHSDERQFVRPATAWNETTPERVAAAPGAGGKANRPGRTTAAPIISRE